MIKRPDEIALMAESGRLLAAVFGRLDSLPLAGMSTMQVNDLVEQFIVQELKARPASKGQYGYAYALNASPNQSSATACRRQPMSCAMAISSTLISPWRKMAISPIPARLIWWERSSPRLDVWCR